MAVSVPAVLAEQPRPDFEELYATHQPRVYRTCLAILRNHDDAAEATQEVFSRALPLLTELREPQVWLTTVARNYCFDQLRRQKVRGPGVVLDDDTPGSLRDDPERETMLRDALRQAFEALSGRERRALGRVLLMDDSLGDIAAMLGVSYGAAAQVVSRARRRAALAARAVVGASFGWLIRVTMPEERRRAARLAAQAVESGQQLLLAAAFVLTAGGLTQAQAVAPASLGGPSVVRVAPAAAPQDAPGSPPALRQASAPPSLGNAGSPLPAGFVAGPISSGPSGVPPFDEGGPPPTPPPVTLSVTYPTVSGHCATSGVAAAAGAQPVVDQPVTACAP